MRLPAYPALRVSVMPTADRDGYLVQVSYRRKVIGVRATDLHGCVLAMRHSFEGRHNLGDTDPACPLCRAEGES